jgi:hypothetical protein
VRKSLGVALVAAVVAAAVTAIVALWLPAVNASKDRTWLAAGQRALAQVTLPASYRPYDNATAKIKVCSNGPDLRCFVGAGNPQQNVAAVQAAMEPLASGPVRAACHPVPLPGSPPTCVIPVPVTGSRIVVDLFARVIPRGPRMSHLVYRGTYVELHVDQR